MKRTLLSALIIALLVMPLVPFSGCGDARPNVEEVIASAIKATDEVQTYRMNMESNGIGEGKPEQSSAWMEFVAPDRIHVISQQLTENGSGEEQIQIGTMSYTRAINSNDWHIRDLEDEIFTVRNIATDMLHFIAELVDIKELTDEKIDGVDCFHYIVSTNMKGKQEEQIALLDQSDPNYEQHKLVYESIEYVRDDVEFWIGKNDYILRKFIIYMEINTFKDKGEITEEVENSIVSTTFKFYDFNEPIEIKPPLIEPS